MSFSGSLERMKIIAYKDEDFTQQAGTFTVMLNPESYSHSYKVCYNDITAQGSPGASPDFNKIAKEEVTFDLVFDGTGVIPTAIPGLVPYTEDGVAPQIEEFKNLVFTYKGNIHSPNYLKLVWGKLLFRCRFTKMDLSFTLFKPDGTPLRARAKATFVGFNDEEELERQANKSSPDLTHVMTVKGGDTLPYMCYSIYGECGLYPQVARVNGLTDFRSLAVGTQLVFPPLGDGGSDVLAAEDEALEEELLGETLGESAA